MNQLVHLEEFEQILSHYHIATAGKKILAESRLALLVGPTASGRDTVISELLNNGEFFYIISDTTRKPRSNNGILEKNGVEYWFRSEDEFLADLKTGKLLEAEIIHGQQVSGISIRELAKANEENKIAITNVDLNIRTVVDVKPDTHAFIVLPPSFDEWMRRLEGRGDMSSDERYRRLKTALEVFSAGLEWPFFKFIINDSVTEAASQIKEIIGGTLDQKLQQKGKDLTSKLLSETKDWLLKS